MIPQERQAREESIESCLGPLETTSLTSMKMNSTPRDVAQHEQERERVCIASVCMKLEALHKVARRRREKKEEK